MHICRPDITRVCAEADVYETLLDLNGKNIVELGCGTAAHTRALAATGTARTLIAFEVDRIQHAKNLAAPAPANLEFRYGGAEDIALDDDSVDVVLMFKSLHHVPLASLDQALAEIGRVLKAGGCAYISEPIFAGAFNEVIRLFHDEQRVREAAFSAVERAVRRGQFELAEELFFLAPSVYRDFAEFEQRIIRATHSEHRLDDETFAEVHKRFSAHLGADGAHFAVPMRVDLLRRPA